MKKLLAVYDTDTLYASRLMEHFRKSNWDSFEIILFTKIESLIDLLKYQMIDVLLCSQDTLFEETERENIKYIFPLCSDEKQIDEINNSIYKYQAAGKIASDIMSRYTKLEDKNYTVSNGEVMFVAFFPPVPGEEKIAYAWSMAKELSKRKKVLFIALEQLPTPNISRQEDKGQSMSELLYYLKESNIDYMNKLKSYLCYSEKLSYLTGPAHGFDLLSLSREDMGRLMDGIKEYTDYETVIIYLGIYTEASMEALSRSHEIYIVTRDLSYEELVENEWERQMELIGIQINKLNINRIKLETV